MRERKYKNLLYYVTLIRVLILVWPFASGQIANAAHVKTKLAVAKLSVFSINMSKHLSLITRLI